MSLIWLYYGGCDGFRGLWLLVSFQIEIYQPCPRPESLGCEGCVVSLELGARSANYFRLLFPLLHRPLFFRQWPLFSASASGPLFPVAVRTFILPPARIIFSPYGRYASPPIFNPSAGSPSLPTSDTVHSLLSASLPLPTFGPVCFHCVRCTMPSCCRLPRSLWSHLYIETLFRPSSLTSLYLFYYSFYTHLLSFSPTIIRITLPQQTSSLDDYGATANRGQNYLIGH